MHTNVTHYNADLYQEAAGPRSADLCGQARYGKRPLELDALWVSLSTLGSVELKLGPDRCLRELLHVDPTLGTARTEK